MSEILDKYDWPFDQPPNCAVITLKQIVNRSQAVMHVTHDADDHGWQFLTLEDAREEHASVVTLSEMLAIDPSIRQLANLPPGWHAWRRAVGDEWLRAPNERQPSEA